MNAKKILVTGGAGYIGAHTVVELIQSGYSPVILDNFSQSDDTLLRGIERIVNTAPVFYKGDCTDTDFLKDVFRKEKSIQGVMHFAAFKSVGESVEKPLDYYRNNVGSLVSLIQVMEECDVHDLIYSSSCTVYGQPDLIPVDETALFKKAESPYGTTKQVCEHILEDLYIARHKLRMVSLRYFNPIGAHPSGNIGEIPLGTPNNLVPFVTQTAAGVRNKLVVFGNDYTTPDGTCVRDYIHVVDLSKAHVRALEYLSLKPEESILKIFNLGTGKGVSVLDIIKRFEQATGQNLAYDFGPRRKGDVEKIYANTDLSYRELKWKTEYSIDEALLHAWNWEKKLRGL